MKFLDKIKRKHYIQCSLTALLTCLVLYITSALWYSRAVIISFDAKSEKDIQYQVFYTEKVGQDFNEKQSVISTVSAGTQKVKIILPIEKLIKLRLNIGKYPGNVFIYDMQAKGLRSVNLNYNDFEKNQINLYEIRNSKQYVKLHIFSSQKNPFITYKNNLDLSGKMQLDFFHLIIISVLAFLIMYKFVQYLSRFKIEKHHSRIDIVMLAVFFGLLWLPMSHISDAEKSEQENRMLAKKPQLTIVGGGDSNFGLQFDEWYNDHFFGREALVYLYNYIKFFIDPMSGNDRVLVGKDGWLFFKLGNGINNYANVTEISEQALENSLKYLKDVDNWCKKHNKEFYVFIAPDKSKIYGEKYRLIKKQRSDDYSIGAQIYNYVRKNSDIKIIYPRDYLIKNKDKGLLYYKQDTHWTGLGAYIGYKKLMEEMKIPPVEVAHPKGKYNADLHKMYPILDDDVSSDEYYNGIHENCKVIDIGNINCYNKKGKKKVYAQRDSFMGSLFGFLANNFENIYLYEKYVFTKEDLDFIDKNADILIIETVERSISRFNQQFPKLPEEN